MLLKVKKEIPKGRAIPSSTAGRENTCVKKKFKYLKIHKYAKFKQMPTMKAGFFNFSLRMQMPKRKVKKDKASKIIS